MDDEFDQEIFREEMPTFRSVRLGVSSECEVKLDTQDMGDAVSQAFGDDDYEFWVTVPPQATRKLLFTLLREKYAGRAKAVDEFRAFCNEHKIENEWQSWT